MLISRIVWRISISAIVYIVFELLRERASYCSHSIFKMMNLITWKWSKRDFLVHNSGLSLPLRYTVTWIKNWRHPVEHLSGTDLHNTFGLILRPLSNEIQWRTRRSSWDRMMEQSQSNFHARSSWTECLYQVQRYNQRIPYWCSKYVAGPRVQFSKASSRLVHTLKSFTSRRAQVNWIELAQVSRSI